jgi:hypothetical protein
LWYKQGILYKGACGALAARVSRWEGAHVGASGVAKEWGKGPAQNTSPQQQWRSRCCLPCHPSRRAHASALSICNVHYRCRELNLEGARDSGSAAVPWLRLLRGVALLASSSIITAVVPIKITRKLYRAAAYSMSNDDAGVFVLTKDRHFLLAPESLTPLFKPWHLHYRSAPGAGYLTPTSSPQQKPIDPGGHDAP